MLSNIIRFAKNIVVSLIAIFVCFGVLDFLWLGVIADGWYQSEMAPLLRSQFITWPWVVFYLMYGCVVFVLAVVANRDKSLLYAGIDGALLGLAPSRGETCTPCSLSLRRSLSQHAPWGQFQPRTGPQGPLFAKKTYAQRPLKKSGED